MENTHETTTAQQAAVMPASDYPAEQASAASTPTIKELLALKFDAWTPAVRKIEPAPAVSAKGSAPPFFSDLDAGEKARKKALLHEKFDTVAIEAAGQPKVEEQAAMKKAAAEKAPVEMEVLQEPAPETLEVPAADTVPAEPADTVAPSGPFIHTDEVLGEMALMHNLTEEVHVKVDNGRAYETMPVESPRFMKHLAWRHYKKKKEVPSKADLKKLMRKLAWTGLFDGTQNASFIRYAKIGDTLYVDLGDPAGHYVEITADGWSLRRHDFNSPWFLRNPNMLEQVKPERGGRIRDLAPFLNIRSEAQFTLIVAFILGAMNPVGPFPMLTVHGPQGAAKSTMLRIIGSLVDPSIAALSSQPKSEQDLFIAASHGWLQNIDNVSAIKDTMSNAYCRLTTGGTFRTRKLYTTNEEVVITVKRPLAFNGITQFAKQNDFLDRSIWIELAPIYTSDRRTETEFWAAWEQARPKILGAFYSALATALKNYDQVKLDSMPRLADFAKWVVAAEPACPWDPGKFEAAYDGNRIDMVDMAIEADPVAEMILKLMDGKYEPNYTASTLLKSLHKLAPTDVKKQKEWPKAPNTLANRLMEIQGFLANKGITIMRKRLSNKRLIILSKVASEPASVSKKFDQPAPMQNSGVSAAELDALFDQDAFVDGSSEPAESSEAAVAAAQAFATARG
ncbi:MAG: hypothetical protein ABIL58_15345 [Pseudomonadota bacterium]